jgi:hypothetical protein
MNSADFSEAHSLQLVSSELFVPQQTSRLVHGQSLTLETVKIT